MQTVLVLGSKLEPGVTPGFVNDDYLIPVYSSESGKPRLLPIPQIANHIAAFGLAARRRPDLLFLVTCVGCGEGGYQPGQIADLFRNMPENVYLQSRLAYGLK